jgi:hypothetical protein
LKADDHYKFRPFLATTAEKSTCLKPKKPIETKPIVTELTIDTREEHHKRRNDNFLKPEIAHGMQK